MRRSVLVVEDEPDITLICRVALELGGFEVLEAGTGQEALDLLAGMSPDAVLLDIRLPDMDGWDVIDRLRAGNSFDGLRIIAFSAHASGSRRALEMGCRAFVAKPFSPDELVRTVRAVLAA